MTSISSSMIEYEGTTPSHSFRDCSQIFKQFTISEVLCIPSSKPNIEQILKVSISGSINDTRIINTPVGTSLEGQHLTGLKMIVEGNLLLKIQYVADLPEQSVHVVHNNIPFTTFIVIPTSYANISNVFHSLYIEDIFSSQLDQRSISNNITLIVTLDH